MVAENSGTLAGQRLGPYQLIDKIGEGGMGAVYKARDISLQRTVAVKVLPSALAADKIYVTRFVREARSVAKLSHPNLVHIYHVGQKEGLYYFAMEHIEGRTLSGVLHSGGPLSVPECLRISGQTLAALQKIHAVDLTHRDIKSGNVMIEAGTSRAVLMDFGLAKDSGPRDDGKPDLTSAGVIMGTPEYMSPEQAEGEDVDARSDIYAFGIMAFEMLTGVVPFTGKSAIAILRKQVEEPVPPMKDLGVVVPAALEAVVVKAMAKKPAQRYQTACEMAADLLRIGQTPELAELAASSLPATARTLVGAGLGIDSSAVTMTTERMPGGKLSRKAWLIWFFAGVIGMFILLAFMARGNGSQDPDNGKGPTKDPIKNGGSLNGTGNGSSDQPLEKPGMVGLLVSQSGQTVKVRVLEIKNGLLLVQELDKAGQDVGKPVTVKLSDFKEYIRQ
jgi:serine/threonine protein kinase